jgi:sortase A
VLLLVVISQWGSAAWILAKAQLAQWLIADAWAETLQMPSLPKKPWPWADTWPVARLQFPARKVDLYILEGDQGNSLAFGPGHQLGTALPGAGMSVIGGHRDTHFRFLQHVKVGDNFNVQVASGQRFYYRVQRLEVVDIHKQPLQIIPAMQGVVLVTCYPFDAIAANGSERLLVWADSMVPIVGKNEGVSF